MEVFGHVYAT
jgi:hypothetical protein